MAIKTVKIPASTGQIVYGKLETDPGSCVSLVQQILGNNFDQYIIGKTLVNKNTDIFVRVYNISYNNGKKDVIGTFEPDKSKARCKDSAPRTPKVNQQVLQSLEKSWDHLSHE